MQQRTYVELQSDLQVELHSVEHVKAAKHLLLLGDHGLAHGQTGYRWIEVDVVLVETILNHHLYREHVRT